ncbi:cytochrome c oxidase assembly protein COX11, mitochondrial-like protein [Polychytrium aggregatum]|uniref:cytochrome c oxidase assembly protein COX11, mitochondrial-like protein n=1 Tax=Polychytrium aggregatum TaxID=110093 RepID=UPI0022FEF977|nr:cytochrome c oxidase assembly protein COX11, mitochondrial-like protein [Polychytrium aggregatum]KAI9208632.1 cytochrome c oxidase assembly protein COX11, mitochondrial-like protein [Polychytrium aggregatum]
MLRLPWRSAGVLGRCCLIPPTPWAAKSPVMPPAMSPVMSSTLRGLPVCLRMLSTSPRLRASVPPSTTDAMDYRERYWKQKRHESMTTAYYSASVIVIFIGLSFAAVPLYKLVCTQTGLDGTPLTTAGHKFEPESMKPVPGSRKIKISFAASTSDAMKWHFVPETKELYVQPGETALAFFTAYNPLDEDIVGISTYSVVPPKAAQYFNKIQCFCFDEQKLNAKEEVDMPVFFYIDPEFAYDPWMQDIKHITLHYTFFKSKHQY